MPLVWAIGSDKPCGTCEGLDGNVDGDGWSSLADKSNTVWIKQADGSWKEFSIAARTLSGPPPIHQHCHCSTYEDPKAATIEQRTTPPPTATEAFTEQITKPPRLVCAHWPLLD